MTMLGKGPATDPATGELSNSAARSKRAQEEWLEKHAALISDLSGKGGPVVREIVTVLEQKINDLVKKDPECQVLIKILSKFGITVNYGKRIAQYLNSELEKDE